MSLYQSDVRKAPAVLETSVSAQPYVMTIVYAVTGKDNRLQNNIGREEEREKWIVAG